MKNHQKGAVDIYLIVALILVVGVGIFAFSRLQEADETVSNNEAASTNSVVVSEAKDSNKVENKPAINTNVVAACKQRQVEETAPSADEFDCDGIALVDSSVGGFELYEESDTWMLAAQGDVGWTVALWSSKKDNLDVCDTPSDSPDLASYCAAN